MTPTPKGVLFRDREEKRRLESRNGIIQFRFVVHTVSNWTPESRLSSDLLLELQRLAVNQIFRCAGHFRDGEVTLQGVSHQPPDHSRVIELVDEMCAYVNDRWASASAIHLAAYLMWRVNWIHPFFGGNGRCSRAISYLILSAKLEMVLPGRSTIPELIAANREPYYEALQKADERFAQGTIDVGAMEELLSGLLAKQLLNLHNDATGDKVG